jgi:ABC-2 type transport system ATP-binding protein
MLGADHIDMRTGDDAVAAATLRERFGVEAVASPHGLSVHAENGARLVPRLCASLGVPVHEVTVTRPSLDDVFLYYTGHRIRDEPAKGR